jgi:hypothetical protein
MQSRSIGDFVPATRDRPFGVLFEAFLPDNAAQGFGASRVQPLAASPAFFRSQTGSSSDDRVINSVLQGREAFIAGMKKRARVIERSSRAWRDLDARAAMACLAQQHNQSALSGGENSSESSHQSPASKASTVDGAEASAAADRGRPRPFDCFFGRPTFGSAEKKLLKTFDPALTASSADLKSFLSLM